MSKSEQRMGGFGKVQLLPVIFIGLALLALLRAGNIWVGFSGANADEIGSTTQLEIEQATPLENSAGKALSVEGADRALFNQLAERHEALNEREHRLDTREALLFEAERSLGAKISKIRSESDVLNELFAKRDAVIEEEYKALSNAYERMKPRDAAQIFEDLEEDILVPVASGMRTQAISGVLAEMTPEKARLLTQKLAERTKLLSEAE